MKKMTKQLFAAAVALVAFNACSDSNFAEVETGLPIPEPTGQNSVVLTDANGQQVASLPASFSTCYLDIKTDGAWYIETPNNMEFTPTKMSGIGSARVPVMIGNNWAEARELSYKVNFVGAAAATRGSGDNPQTVTQQSNTNLEGFKQVINSNTFVGYGYYPAKHVRPELCTGVQIFKMDGNPAYVVNSLAPQNDEFYFYAHSDSVLDKVVAVNGHPGGNFGAVKMQLDLDNVNVTRKNKFEVTVMQKSLTRSVYSREIRNWEEVAIDENLTAGFLKSKQRFIDQLKAAGTDEAKKKAAAELLFNDVGTHFVHKGMLGSELDYRLAVAKSKAEKSTDVKAALNFKWTQQVKDTAKVDSAVADSLKKLIPDSLRKNFVFHAGVLVKDSTFSAASSTMAQVKARGGDVERVSILATGGTLNCADLAMWLLSTEPEKATMTEILVEPIYRLFKETGGTEDETAAYTYLKDLIDTKYNLKKAQDGFGKLEN
ncbi:MAG: hypothetical protein J5954_04170 [Prevotella sp.]|nr:hypothetical protein [Prevotella sp.]